MGQQAIPTPPKVDRINYYITGRVAPEYSEWARRDLASRDWTRRQWVIFTASALVGWVLAVVAGAPPFDWSVLAGVGGGALILLATEPLRRKAALNRLNKKPLPRPTATGMPARTSSREPDEAPDAMQSFYAKRRK
jgi:hypothetical protein